MSLFQKGILQTTCLKQLEILDFSFLVYFFSGACYQNNLMHVFSEVTTIIFSVAYSQETI